MSRLRGYELQPLDTPPMIVHPLRHQQFRIVLYCIDYSDNPAVLPALTEETDPRLFSQTAVDSESLTPSNPKFDHRNKLA
ncbi:hypothetical protein BaRGS_00004065 [Batillaria attramentaria]|uniref:Uncharacterized protein n=1 Tax=Batillaria attramentaria TaxID=370345 RepID=A0ABD0LZY2_9CAEN